MENFQPTSTNDILKEPYKGPGPLITSAGYIYASHMVSVIVGAIFLGTAASLAHSQVNGLVNTVRRKAAGMNKKSGGFITWLVGVEHGSSTLATELKTIKSQTPISDDLESLVIESERGAFQTVSAKVLKLPGLKNLLEKTDKERVSAAIMGGGLGGITGYVGSSAWGALKGGHESVTGKRQFERAITEIKDLRETNDDLEKINDVLHAKYVEAATSLNDFRTTKEAEEGKLRVAADQQPVTALPPQAELADRRFNPASPVVTAAMHSGTVSERSNATEAALV